LFGKLGEVKTPDEPFSAPPHSSGVVGVGAIVVGGAIVLVGASVVVGVTSVVVGVSVVGRDLTLHPLVLQHSVIQDESTPPKLSLREAHATSQKNSGKHPLEKLSEFKCELNAS